MVLTCLRWKYVIYFITFFESNNSYNYFIEIK